jgi:hypothetical protein
MFGSIKSIRNDMYNKVIDYIYINTELIIDRLAARRVKFKNGGGKTPRTLNTGINMI